LHFVYTLSSAVSIFTMTSVDAHFATSMGKRHIGRRNPKSAATGEYVPLLALARVMKIGEP